MTLKKWAKSVSLTLFAAILCIMPVISGRVAVSAETASGVKEDFTDGFENYSVTGNYIENDDLLTSVWDNNVFRGGEALGMDAHIVNVGKIEYENGTSGSKVLHLKNTSGADTFFYMGPNGDYRVRNFTAQFKVKFLTEGVSERSWVGFSFRKKSNVHYTGTNNLLFFVQRYADTATVTGHAFAVFDGGSPGDLAQIQTGGLYGDKLTIERANYDVPDGAAGEDLPWLTVKLEVTDNRYMLYADNTKVVDCTFDIPNYDYYGFLSLNCCTSNILIDDFSVEVKDTAAPPEILPLPSPVVTLDSAAKKISWEAVPGATTYIVKVGETQKTVSDLEYSLDKLSAGSYNITVTAVSGDTFEALDSLPSEAVTFTVENASDNDDGSCSGGLDGGSLALGGGLIFFALCALGFKFYAKGKNKDEK